MVTTPKRLAAMESKYIDELRARRRELVTEIRAVDAKLSAVQSPAGVGDASAGGKRARRGKPLRVYIEEVLAKARGAMSAKHIQQAVLAHGYKTQSTSLYIQILTALRKSANVRRVKRGQYSLTAKARSAAAKSA